MSWLRAVLISMAAMFLSFSCRAPALAQVHPEGHGATAGAPLAARHIHIRVTDVERTKTFYRDKLGLKVTNERPGEVVEFPGLWFGKFRGTGKLETGGITIGMGAASVQKTYDELKAKGVNIPKPPAPARDEWAFGLTDPDGYAIEIEGPK